MSYILIFSRASGTGLQDILTTNWGTSLDGSALRELRNWLRRNALYISACTGNHPGSISHPWWNKECNYCVRRSNQVSRQNKQNRRSRILNGGSVGKIGCGAAAGALIYASV